MVGVPTYPGHFYCRQRFVERLHQINPPEQTRIIWNGDNLWGFDEFKIDVVNQGTLRGAELLAKKQEMFRAEFLKRSSYTHLLLLESDTIPPKNVIEQLARHDRDIVSAFYTVKSTQSAIHQTGENLRQAAREQGVAKFDDALVIRQKPAPTFHGVFHSCIYGNSARLWTMDDYFEYLSEGITLVPVVAGGVGCVLIKRRVLEEIGFRARPEEMTEQQLTDFLFYMDASGKGFEGFVDLSCVCLHLHADWSDQYHTSRWFDPQTGFMEIEHTQQQRWLG